MNQVDYRERIEAITGDIFPVTYMKYHKKSAILFRLVSALIFRYFLSFWLS